MNYVGNEGNVQDELRNEERVYRWMECGNEMFWCCYAMRIGFSYVAPSDLVGSDLDALGIISVKASTQAIRDFLNFY